MSGYGKNTPYLPLFCFVFLGVVWGSNFIYMKLAANHISAMQIVFYRVLFGLLPVAAYAGITKSLSMSHLKHAGHFLVMALTATTIYYWAFVKGVSLLLSGVAGAVSGSIPLFSVVLALMFLPEEKITKYRILGLMVGLAGVLILGLPSDPSISVSHANLLGVFYMIAGSLSVGASFVYAKKFITPLSIPASALTTYQLSGGLLLLAITTDYNGIGNIWTDLHASLGLIIGLGLLGTGLAYIIYYYIVEQLGAVTASSVTYIPPVVALAIGAILVGEPIMLRDYLATLIIFVGVFLLKKG